MLRKVAPLVGTKWLHSVLSSDVAPKSLRVLDCSWHMPDTKRSGRDEYKEKHIPGAAFFDIDECCDKASPYGHMLPQTKEFERYVGDMGVDAGTHVIVYDNCQNFGFFSAPRVWWMFRVFGHESVSILDGGFPKWCKEGYPTSSEVETPTKTVFHGLYQPHLVKSFEDMVDNITNKSFEVMDARGKGRFSGKEPEPREGIEPGHILGAKNLPYKNIVDKEEGVLLDKPSLQKVFEEAEVDLTKPLVASCGSGVSACCTAFAAYMCDAEVPVYDGSWTEFYKRSTTDLRFCPSDKQ